MWKNEQLGAEGWDCAQDLERFSSHRGKVPGEDLGLKPCEH